MRGRWLFVSLFSIVLGSGYNVVALPFAFFGDISCKVGTLSFNISCDDFGID